MVAASMLMIVIAKSIRWDDYAAIVNKNPQFDRQTVAKGIQVV